MIGQCAWNLFSLMVGFGNTIGTGPLLTRPWRQNACDSHHFSYIQGVFFFKRHILILNNFWNSRPIEMKFCRFVENSLAFFVIPTSTKSVHWEKRYDASKLKPNFTRKPTVLRRQTPDLRTLFASYLFLLFSSCKPTFLNLNEKHNVG